MQLDGRRSDSLSIGFNNFHFLEVDFCTLGDENASHAYLQSEILRHLKTKLPEVTYASINFQPNFNPCVK